MCLDAEQGQIVVLWNTNFTDTLTLSPDGNTLNGANDQGGTLMVKRQPSRCSQVIGLWAWDVRAFPATMYPNGQVVGTDGGQEIHAKWVCINAPKGQIAVKWNTGFTDTLTLAPDAKTLNGANDKGGKLVVKRRME